MGCTWQKFSLSGPRTPSHPEPFCYTDTGTQGSDHKPWQPNFFLTIFTMINEWLICWKPIFVSLPRPIHFLGFRMCRNTIWAQHNDNPVRNRAPAEIVSSKTPVWEGVHACVPLKVKAAHTMRSFSFIERKSRERLSLSSWTWHYLRWIWKDT